MLVEARSDHEVREALRWAAAAERPVTVLGGGSNVVVADAGVPGLVVHLTGGWVSLESDADGLLLRATAGQPWDRVVEASVDAGLAGLECLSGIPGTVGATPIQNVGAYGVEVGDLIEWVRVLDRETLEEGFLGADECRFAYRWSRFRDEPERWVVLEVAFRLTRGRGHPLAYRELAELFQEDSPPPAEVRRAVLGLRRGKSMVVDPEDPNRRSVGSFFVNPVVAAARWPELVARAAAAGVIAGEAEIPRFPVDGGFKVPAGWLVERAGFARGHRQGEVGLSSAHALCLVHHGGGTTADLVALARSIQSRVDELFGLRLRAEPSFLGFSEHPLG